ncbi:MAG: ABC transporter ATP-binding protein [Chloroflexota bacterium]
MYLTLNDIVKVFPPRGGSKEVTAVDGVSLQIEKGELITLLGPSGCGKTTVLRIIAGFEFPTSGGVRLDSKEINMLPPNKRDMSMVFQSYAIFPHLDVLENISYGLNVKRLSRGEIQERVGRIMDLVQLSGLEARAPNQLSGGQQQRVALARALVMEPKVLLMDEPLSNLDAKLREQMRVEIRRIQSELGITSVYVTHDQLEAMTLSDRVVVMNQGKIEQVGTPVDIYRRPQSRFVADFIGRANFIPGVALGREDGSLVVDVYGERLHLSDVKEAYAPQSAVTLVLRPEMIQITPAASKFKGVVRQATYLGNVIDYVVELNGLLLNAVETSPLHMELFAEGTQVGVDFFTPCVHVIPG